MGRKLMHVPKRSARQEYRLKQREQVLASPIISEKFPDLSALTAVLEYFDEPGITRNGQMKCTINLGQARSALWFACPRGECVGGDFDLTEALGRAVTHRLKTLTGEMICQGTRKHGERGRQICHTLLRYKLILRYD